MQHPDTSNKDFELAVQFVNQTNRHVFVTGRAGTGKTTFLKYIRQTCPKKLAVVAPTGVAAMNAGGVTIHSMFQLPFGAFLPANDPGEVAEDSVFHNRKSLLSHLRINKDKRELIMELDLLIIDEVSMVRADLLDAIDTVLRHIRRKPYLPFGGVQMLFIGDLFQLPPVVKDADRSVLKQYYQGSFFFHAVVLQNSPPLYIELKKIYRQSDEVFIRLLNNLRNSTVTEDDIRLLQNHYKPGFQPESKGEYIVLTTHNSKADSINQEELDALPGAPKTFKAEIEGVVNEAALPAEKELKLKKGAQIMFIKNDKGETRRYYNGKTGIVSRLTNREIYVTFPDEETEMLVEKEVWENIRYSYNKETDEVEEDVLGQYKQFPIRLAWAITIHKSQGLTFRKAIVDAGRSFAPGQVYVALSRLTSLDGLILQSPIDPGVVNTDKEAVGFSKTEMKEDMMLQQLQEDRQRYIYTALINAFDWSKLTMQAETFRANLETRKIPVIKEAIDLADQLLQSVREQEKTAEAFTKQLQKLLNTAQEEGFEKVRERVNAAEIWFCDALENQLLKPLLSHQEYVRKQTKVRKYLRDINDLRSAISGRKHQIALIAKITTGLSQGADTVQLLKQIRSEEKRSAAERTTEEKKVMVATKTVKGQSQRLSLEMFNKGQSVEDIAIARNLAISTIEGHLASFVVTGEVTVEQLVPEEKIALINKVIDTFDTEEPASSEIKEKLGDEFSYGEIRAVQAFRKLPANEDATQQR